MFFVNVKGLQENDAHFKLSTINDSKELIDEGRENTLSGTLVKAMHRIWEYKGETNDSIIIVLNDPNSGDGGESYRIEMSMNSIGRGIVNALLSAENFIEPIEIWVGVNKKGYNSVSVRQGGERLEWALDLDEQAKHITKETVKKKNAESGKIEKKEMNNYIELNDYMIKMFKEKVVPAVSSSSNEVQSDTSSERPTASWPTQADEPVAVGDEADDLPF